MCALHVCVGAGVNGITCGTSSHYPIHAARQVLVDSLNTVVLAMVV
jgi:hypothetical protein